MNSMRRFPELATMTVFKKKGDPYEIDFLKKQALGFDPADQKSLEKDFLNTLSDFLFEDSLEDNISCIILEGWLVEAVRYTYPNLIKISKEALKIDSDKVSLWVYLTKPDSDFIIQNSKFLIKVLEKVLVPYWEHSKREEEDRLIQYILNTDLS